MSANINYQNEKRLFDYINNFLLISDLDSLLDKICEEVPSIINGKDCSIFLIPELLKQYKEYTGQLTRGDETTALASELDSEFIVLARTTREEFKKKIGKAFYQKGYGLTGWIFEKRRPLQIKDMQNKDELGAIDKNLEWTDKYKGGEYRFFGERRKMPFLGVPLIKGNSILGVIRVGDSLKGDSFPAYAQDALMSFAGILSNLIEKIELIEKQMKSIERFVKIGSTRDRQEVFDSIVKQASTLVDAENCELYTLDKFGEKIVLQATTEGYMQELKRTAEAKLYQRGDGLTGWVFKTGKPLFIKNVEDFKKGKFLSDQDLEDKSDGIEINHKDRWIKWLDLDGQYQKQHTVVHPHFLGVPIKSEIGEVVGVLRVSGPTSKRSFDKKEMQLLQDFAGNISLILYNERQKQLNQVLIQIGNIHHKDELFNYVVNQIPQLVLGRGCSVFLKEPSSKKLALRYTSSDRLKKNGSQQGDVIDLPYEYGEGKTGFVADIGRPLLINYYGSGKIQKRKIEEDFIKFSKYSNNLVDYLQDDEGNHVGITRVFERDERTFTAEEEDNFYNFCKKGLVYYKETGLPSPKKKRCETGELKYAQSFLAVPIKSKTGGLLGVIRIPRSSEGGRFSYNDLILLESVVTRLTSTLEIEANLKILSDINSSITSSCTKDQILNRILEAVTDTLGFEFATIQLVNREKDTIETITGRKNGTINDAVNPEGWLGSSNPLNPPEGEKRDIHAYVLMEVKKPIVIKGWDDHFNKEIYNRFHHENLVRAFVPIIAYEPKTGEEIKIGTFEAGHNINRKDKIDDQELEMVKAVANQVAITIRNWEQREELKALKDKAVFKSLSRVGHFLSHKMNGCVGWIKLTSKDLIDECDGRYFDMQKFKESLENIIRRSDEALFLPEHLDELLNKYGSLSKTRFRFDELQQDVIDAIERNLLQSSQNITVIKDFNISSNVQIYADKNLLYWTFDELFHNAVLAMPGGGKIRLIAAQEGSFISITIADTGKGIPQHLLANVTEPGFTTRGGKGQGLWLCKTVIEEIHDGIFFVKSDGGNGGTRITIKLRLE